MNGVGQQPVANPAIEFLLRDGRAVCSAKLSYEGQFELRIAWAQQPHRLGKFADALVTKQAADEQ